MIEYYKLVNKRLKYTKYAYFNSIKLNKNQELINLKTTQDNTKIPRNQVTIPTHILQNRSIHVLEAISHYLKEEKKFNYREIGKLLNRNERTIWTSCNRIKNKIEKKYAIQGFNIEIPVSNLTNRKISILESIVKYLKEEKNLGFREIGFLLSRNERTIWTVYDRTQKKLKNKENILGGWSK